jgi:hypothetical protein
MFQSKYRYHQFGRFLVEKKSKNTEMSKSFSIFLPERQIGKHPVRGSPEK